MRIKLLMLATLLPLIACGPRTVDRGPYPGRGGDVIILGDGRDGDRRRDRGDRDRDRDERKSPRSLRGIPAGHYPPPGECRVWYPDRPAGHQPPPRRCDALYGRVPFGSFLLYNRRA